MHRNLTTQTFQRGPGPGNRILAVGLPEYLAVSGDWMVWESSGGVFVQHDRRVLFVAVDRLLKVSIGGDKCVVACCLEADVQVIFIDSSLSTCVFGIDGALMGVGVDTVVFRGPNGCVARRVDSAETLPLPVGAKDGDTVPFSMGFGVVWADGANVMRLRAGSRPSVVGSLPSPPREWVAGPQGSCLFDVDGELWCAAPRGGLVLLGAYEIESCRFDAQGSRLMVCGSRGTEMFDTLTGKLIDRAGSSSWPVGFTAVPLVLDEDHGVIRTFDGIVHQIGLAPSAVCTDGDRVFGPGGTAWHRLSGEQLWSHAPLCAEHLLMVDESLIQVGDRIEVFSRAGDALGAAPLPIDPDLEGELVDVRAIDGGLRCICENGWTDVDLWGRRRGPFFEGPPPLQTDEGLGRYSTTAHSDWLAVDGSIESSDSRRMVWTEDGFLAQVDEGSLR